MKSILKAESPKSCEQIVNGEKTMLLSKTCPKLETPFKGYIYCTKGKEVLVTNKVVSWTGEVICEFVCDEIVTDTAGQFADRFHEEGKLTLDEQRKYGGNKPLYGLHISELKIYDTPKELGEFRTPKNPHRIGNSHSWILEGYKKLTRPPQSWCYVEELEA